MDFLKALWVVVFMLVVGKLQAQFSKLDSSLLIQFADKGLRPGRTDSAIAKLHAGDFYLIKFRQPLRENETGFKTVRLLSDHHAIVILTGPANDVSFIRNLEYIFPANNEWKLPPGFLSQKINASRFLVTPVMIVDFLQLLHSLNGKLIYENTSANSFLIELQQ